MSFKKKADEIAFNRKYSRFKLQIFFTKRGAITHYGQERYGCTVAQIRFGHIKQVVLDRERGLQDCIDRIELCVKLYGPYQAALIYDRRKDTRMPDGTVQVGKEIRKYVNGELVEYDEIVLTMKERRIITTVIHDDVKGWSLKPIEDISPQENIDFKTEVAKALNK